MSVNPHSAGHSTSADSVCSAAARKIESALADTDVSAGFSAYVHIPFCSVRCGYCDFNTYTNLHFGGGASVRAFADTLMREIDLSAQILTHNHGQSLLNTVFFGGGTPTLLPTNDLTRILTHLREICGITANAEITTEANPESVTPQTLAALKDAGFTRISFGMQSAVEHVLHTLERTHTPGQVTAVTKEAQRLGLDYSVDLIYGAPGESLDDWRRSLDAAIALEPNHISAYALTVEPHVPMGRKIARGLIPDIDPDEQAEKYEIADDILSQAGYCWYEISNWAKPGHESRHNITYWTEGNWWGYGPGAHSHINGIRWWNLKHPIAYAQALEGIKDWELSRHRSCHALHGGVLPIDDYEHLTAEEIREERIMLGIRLSQGLPVSAVVDSASDTVTTAVSGINMCIPQARMSIIKQLVSDGLLEAEPLCDSHCPRLILTMRGRLLADTVIRSLW